MPFFRSAVPSDADALSRLATETFHDGWAPIIGEEFATAYAAEHLHGDQLRAEIEDVDTHYFALATDEKTSAIVGYGKLSLKRPPHESVLGPRPVVLQRFYVAASGRGTGIADALLTVCEREAMRRGFSTLWLECDPRNERAWRFYEKRGFVARGAAVYHYPNGVNDQIRIMERAIKQDSSPPKANGQGMDIRPPYEPVKGLVALVNPLQGTDSTYSFSTGNTLPLVAVPHGMTHWSPQTNTQNDGWFFHPRDHVFNGMRATHQPSPWIGDYGQFVLMPQAGPLKPEAWERSSSCRTLHHRADYFAAYLHRDGWFVTLAPTERCAVFGAYRDRSTKGTPVRLLLERFGDEEPLTWDRNANCVRGYTRKNKGGVPDNWAHYFVIYPDSVIVDVSERKTRDGRTVTIIEIEPESYGFETRIGTSFISTEQADANLAREVGNGFVTQIADRAGARWNELLGRITINGATADQERTFYSCLYRALLFPRALHEPDANDQPHHFSPYTGTVLPGVLYTDNGFWDTFRTVYPLLSLVYPDILGPIIDGWLNVYRESGFLPEWASPGHRACMVGTHSQAVIADAVAKGIPGFDYGTALDAVVKGATTAVPDGAAFGRSGLAEYDTLGYIPCDRIDKATSRTLDYAYDDYCVAQIARAVGRDDLYEQFLAKSERWRNVWDGETKFFRGRLASGEWLEPFVPHEWGGAFVEGSAYQFRFSVPHDPAGFAALWGGADAMAEAISAMAGGAPLYAVGSYGQTIHEMTEMATARFGQYAHSNQPVHATLHMAAAVGIGAVTNRLTHRVLNELYSPDTFPGDEDNGEMGAWYVLAAMGIFPLCPGSGEYVLNVPLFDAVRIVLPGGGEALRIFSDGKARQSGTWETEQTLWNNHSLPTLTIRHEELARGGELHFLGH